MVELPFVIGAGLGRTGTLSLKSALNELGYKTMHMTEIRDGNADAISWFNLAEAKRKGKPRETIDKLTSEATRLIRSQGYNATTDFPSCLVFEELLSENPDAKVILSIRSSGEEWTKSMLATIATLGPMLHNTAPLKFITFYSRFLNDFHPWTMEEIGIASLGDLDPGAPLDKDMLVKAYDDWTKHVIATVPNQQLLVHQSSEGFGPICKHLGIPNSDCPIEYPYINDTASFQNALRIYKYATLLFSLISPLLFFFSLFFFTRKMLNTSRKGKNNTPMGFPAKIQFNKYY